MYFFYQNSTSTKTASSNSSAVSMLQGYIPSTRRVNDIPTGQGKGGTSHFYAGFVCSTRHGKMDWTQIKQNLHPPQPLFFSQ
jgi:hypothetical protein